MEFKVRTKKLKGSAQAINGSAKHIKAAESKIDGVIRDLDVGSATGDIRNTLRKSKAKLTFLSAATSQFDRNLKSIATQYERTEAAIKNQRIRKEQLAAISRAKKVFDKAVKKIKDSYHRGKNAYNKYVGDPVNLDNGNFIYEANDLEIDGTEPFVFTRIYNSLSEDHGSFGRGWNHNYEIRLSIGTDNAVLSWDDGKQLVFSLENGAFSLISGGNSALQREKDGYRYTTIDGESYLFDKTGAFTRFENSNGVGYSLEYENEKLVKIGKDTGEWFSLTYKDNDNSRIASVSDHTGRTTDYTYHGSDLATVISGDQITAYEYDAIGNMVNIISPSGVRIIHNVYDADGRVIEQRFADDSLMKYTYDDENNATILCEKNGAESYHYHDDLSRNTENVYGDGTESYEYNNDNQITYESDRNGNETKYSYDNRGNVTKIAMANGTVINITYERHNKPATISVNGERRQKNVYDDNGNLIETTDALGHRTSTKYNEKGMPVEIRWPGGSTTELTYDERNNPVTITDDLGIRYSYEYDDLNRVISYTDGNNNRSSFAYDRYGNLTEIRDAAGNSRSYKYNKTNKITEMVDFNGARTRIDYNNLGFPHRMTDPLGRITELGYDKMWNVISEKMPNGGVRKVEYNENNRPVKETDPLGNEIFYEYDGNGNLVSRIDEEGGLTEFKYSSMDELIYVRDPEGNETNYKYDEIGNLVYIRNANGGELHLEYDEINQLIKETDALKQSREYTYTQDGDLASVTDEAGRMMKIEYAARGKASKICYPDGREEFFTYDNNGNVRTRSTNQGFTMHYLYDELDRLIEANGSNGEHYAYTYDEVGNLTSAADADGNTSLYEYSLSGQLVSVTDELGNRTEYEYDDLDMLTGINRTGDGEVHRTEYIRDVAGNVMKTVDPLGYIEEFAYNKRGELIRKTDKDGYLTEYGYDFNGNLNSIRYSDGREVMMSHDALDKLAEIRDWTGVTKVESDILGRVTKVIYPDERTAEYTYGKTGERTSIKHPDGRVVNYGYDEAHRLSSLKEGDTDIRYSYDKFGQLAGKAFASGLATRYAYDNKGQLTELISSHSGKILDSVKLRYDANGNRISAERMRDGIPQDSGLFEYGYDAAGRLTDVRKDGTLQRQYSYDAFGNRISMQTPEGRTDYRYDAMDRLLEVKGLKNESFRYDRRGNIIGRFSGNVETHSYVYGAINRLESAHSAKGVASYEYNGLGHRVEDRIRYDLEPERRISYTLDLTKAFNNLLERNVDGVSDTYIWDGILVGLKGRDNYDFVSDDMGSPSRLLRMDGNNAEVYGYTEFGASLLDEAELQPFGYMGYRNDAVADMYFAQAREYMPEHGRFAAQDWIKGHSAVPASLNAYIYCNSEPFRFVDLDGRFLITALLATAAVGAGVGALVSGGWELGTQLVGQLATGDHRIHWNQIDTGKILTSMLDGAITGGFTAIGHPVIGASIGGFAKGSIDAALEGKDFGSSILSGIIDGAVSGAFAGLGEWFKATKLAKKIKKSFIGSNKVSKFFRKFGSRFKGQLTRATNAAEKGLFIHLTWKTWRNGLISEGYKKVTGLLKPKKYLKKITSGLLKCAFT